jgi:predicted nucleotidyltransferase
VVQEAAPHLGVEALGLQKDDSMPDSRLSPRQHDLVSSLAARLGAVGGVEAVVLGGSHARGRARPESDIDLGLFYSEKSPFEIERVRELAGAVNDVREPVVTGFYEWGPWVNGGAWLTIDGQRLDLIYRSLEHVERVIADAEAGRYELHYLQQPPFGFFSGTYLGEIAICQPLIDPAGLVVRLKARVARYPEALREAVVRDHLWMAEFTLGAFASKYATRADVHGTVTCLTRATNHLILVLFALNRTYPVNDKTALAEIAEFDRAPRAFADRVNAIFARVGTSRDDLRSAAVNVGELVRQTIELTDGLYQPRYALPI